ncbi:MAG: hypothetical protein HY064_12400 [Bacteroidetes bacterium]|nr:hypothetical protein [Bacteroidota bacterium]
MKTQIRNSLLLLLLFIYPFGKISADNVKEKVIVLNIDTKGIVYAPEQMGNLVRVELEKLDTFDVMDRYDVNYLVQKNNLKIGDCYGKICLVEVGKVLGADKILTGSVEQIGDVIIYTMRFINVQTESIERTQVTEFLNLPNELQTMTAVMIRELFNKPVDPNVITQLMKPDSYDARARNPVTEKINLSGPRMGGTFFTSETARVLASPRSQGGYSAFPLMFQFGYQFEAQYLAAGDFQALFEFVPMVTGLDQGLFIPSFTIMNGLRANKHGWEFAFGPTFNVYKRDYGYYDPEHNWITRTQWQNDTANINKTAPAFFQRLDSRGTPSLGSNFVFAFGKTFRSGNLNIPVNFFAIPGRGGWRFGISFGYNSRGRKMV